MSIVGPNEAFLRAQIDAVRNAIGRNVTFYIPSGVPCSLCSASGYLDTYNGISYYTTCPICAGSYYINSAQAHIILARVRFTNDEAIVATPGGKYFTGDATVTIAPEYLNIAQQTQVEGGEVLVDNHKMEIVKIIPLGTIQTNRLRVVLKNMGGRPGE